MLRRSLIILTIALIPVAALACAGDDDSEPDPSPATAASTPATSATPVAAAPTADVERVVDRVDGEPWTQEDATALLGAALLTPDDLPNGPWLLQSDTTSTNADAAQADPATAASNERCGRLLARTTISQIEDAANAFIGGETLSFFSTATVFETRAGADDCSADAAARYAQPGQLARAFGPLFIDPDAVQVAFADFPPVAEGQFSATLTGEIEAGGIVLDITLLIVAFQSENVTAVVGSARSGATPPAEELAPFVELVLARIQANQ